MNFAAPRRETVCHRFLNTARVGAMVFVAALANLRGVPMSELMHSPPKEVVYKTAGNTSLKLLVFAPQGLAKEEKRPAIVWIHGGGWTGGSLDAFMPHARYSAARGAIGINLEYRVATPPSYSIKDCLADCKSALRYVRAHAAQLNVDPEKIAVAGDSAGGHLAACLGTIEGLDDPRDDLSVSAIPNAMILYNPIVDMTDRVWIRFAIGGATMASNQPPAKVSDSELSLARSLSPSFHVHSGEPPTLLMHGREDQIVAFSHSQQFAEAMTKAGNRCELVLLEKTDHAFAIAFWRSPESAVVNVLKTTDRFLASLGFLQGEPTIEVSAKPAW